MYYKYIHVSMIDDTNWMVGHSLAQKTDIYEHISFT